MEFDDIEMAESLGFRESNISRYSSKYGPKYRCYECGGDPSKSTNCPTCKGSKVVGEANPMVQLLSEIMNKKLSGGNRSILMDMPRQTLKPQFSEIKEQSSELAQEKFIFCDGCSHEGELSQYSYCKQCVHFYLCPECVEKGVPHEHHLIRYILSPVESEEEDQVENSMIKKSCDCCSSPIPNKQLYLVCETCKKKGTAYQICHQCHDTKNQDHQDHTFKPQLHRVYEKKESIENPLFERWLDSDKEQRNSEYGFSETGRESKKFLLSRRQSDINVVMDESSSSPVKKNDSRMIVEYEESESDFASKFFDSHNFKNEIDEEGSSESNQEKQYIFYDYECDFCQKNPKIVRYHCLLCQDFDLCEHCYISKKNKHQHDDFQRITKEDENKEKEQSKRKLVKDVLSSIGDMYRSTQIRPKK